MMLYRKVSVVVLAVFVLALGSTSTASACILRDFEVSTEPAVIPANTSFEVIVDYQGSEGCILSEGLTVNPPVLQVEIDCNCFFTPTGPVPQQFRSPVSGLGVGSYEVQVIDAGAVPDPLLAFTTLLQIGQAPSIPISPLALTLLSLILASVAISILRR